MYDVFGSSVPLATLLSSTGVIPVLQQLADTFKQRVSVFCYRRVGLLNACVLSAYYLLSAYTFLVINHG